MTPEPLQSVSDATWRNRLAFLNNLRTMVLIEPPSPDDARKIATFDFDRVPIAAIIQRDVIEAGEAAAEAAATGAAAVLSSTRSSGTVVLHWPDGSKHRIPAGGLPLAPSDWLRAIACALIARDANASAILCSPPHIAASQRPDQLADPFWPFLCTAVAAVIQQPDAAKSWLDEVAPLLEPNRITRADPNVVRLQIAPLLPMLAALVGRGAWDTALRAAIESHQKYFATHGAPADPQRLLPLAVTGLTALAMDRGIARDAAGLPEALFRGDVPRATVDVAFEYATRFAERTEDPMTFFDLEGISPTARKHTIVQQDGHVMASYRLDGIPGMPKATISFILPAPGEQRGDFPPALDPGERVLAAQHYAERSGNASEADPRVPLRQAIEQIDLVLNSIPPNADQVQESAFINPAGRRAWREEPGRFRRDRLTAYRDSLRDQLARLSGDRDRPPRPETESEIASYAKAIAAAEVVKIAVMPILEGLPGASAANVRPRPEDYAKVFVKEAVDQAREAFEKLWNAEIHVDPLAPNQSELRVFVAPAGMLRGENELSRQFPGGYRSVAEQLLPERVWVAWKYACPGESSGTAYDGLVWCDDHWSWFPKPYRFIRERRGP